ncbi:ATP-binding protein [Microbacterium sp. NPDC076895]|uniref:sensor histidine kinase n=1 Tax=Microbacterium sp. NPDC076895 TaxID=3154957 RepID=UPI00341554FE
MISIVLAVGSLALGAQAFVAALGSVQEPEAWHVAFMVANFGSLTALLVTYVVGRSIAPAAIAFCAVFVVTLVVWPFVVAGQDIPPSDPPWTWFLVSVVTASSIMFLPLMWQMAWTIFVPVLFGITRLAQAGFAVDFWWPTLLDVSFAIILGGVFVTLGWMFRSIADNVDESRRTAVETYTAAAVTEAAESERVAVAALMHDSVLAALIASERAQTPREQGLAVAMAQEALTRLANAETDAGLGSDSPRPFGTLVEEVESGARGLGVDLVVERAYGHDAPEIPGRVANALILAAMQAIANSIEHAGGIGLTVCARQEPDTQRLHLEVQDLGDGFDLDTVPDDRLGIRGSIIARVAAVGGTVHITSDSNGTLVRLTWQGARA